MEYEIQMHCVNQFCIEIQLKYMDQEEREIQ